MRGEDSRAAGFRAGGPFLRQFSSLNGRKARISGKFFVRQKNFPEIFHLIQKNATFFSIAHMVFVLILRYNVMCKL